MAQPERMNEFVPGDPFEAKRDDSIIKPGQPKPPAEIGPRPAIVAAGSFAEARSAGWGTVALFSMTLFLSALLLFSVQPIFAKMLLPLLGGAPAVWNTAMLFYQAVLLAGYAYAHFASKFLPPKVHLLSHILLLGVPLLVLPFAVPKGSEPAGGANPVPWLLVAMLVGIGAPFFVVSSTGPLLQRWFSRTGHAASKDPYFLYAASNLGSMLGLLGYPFLVEPHLRLAEQSRIWAYGYMALVFFLVSCGIVLARSNWMRQPALQPVEEDSRGAPSWPRRLKWIALALVPSSLMLGATQYITTDVAAVPLLWVVPLALYLLTFTIVFARRPIIPHKVTLVMMPVTLAGIVAVMALNITKPLLPIVCIHLLAFFFAAMLCHGELAKDRPAVKYLTEFYLWMSVGGVLGGIFNALVAPVAFPLVLEYGLALAAAAALYPGAWRAESIRDWILDFVAPILLIVFVVGAIELERKYGLGSSNQAKTLIIAAGTLGCLLMIKRPLRFGLSIAALLGLGIYFWASARDILHIERSFFGVTRIEKSSGGQFVDIYHGTTLHGQQATAPELRKNPVSYYFPSGPIGVVLNNMDRPEGGSYGVVGLGSGSLAAYGKVGERWTYYEIDPVVKKVAEDPKYFTFLKDSKAKVNVVLGDARVSMKDSKDRYDLLVLDAYSSDAVPIHLLTQEAMAVYQGHLKKGGMIAFHISNKHLDLEPVVHELCKNAGMKSMRFKDKVITPEERLKRKAAADWIFAYPPNKDVSAILKKGNWKPTRAKPGVGLWTDDFSSLWTIYSPEAGRGK